MQQLVDSTFVNTLTEHPLLTLAGILVWCFIVFALGAWFARDAEQPQKSMSLGALAFVAGGCSLAAVLFGFVVCAWSVQAREAEQVEAAFMQVSDDREELYERIMTHIALIDQLEQEAGQSSAGSADEETDVSLPQRWVELAAEFNSLQLEAEEQHARAVEVRSQDTRFSIVENTGKMKAELEKNSKRILQIGVKLMTQP
ncbi:MAG TPA: hypothetical protein DDW52_23390 [Planctomycetaceae bacterium]|nr:hypothetical protein [Planctomycetaceae bacterium]